MARHPPATRYAKSSGAQIAFQVSGAGPLDLVMVPGLVSHLDIQWQQAGYRRFVRALEHGCRVIRLDKRGTGLSDPVRELPTIDERVQDVASVMAAANSSRAVLFGMSDGGRAAIAFAAAHPAMTQALILYGTSYRGPRAALLRRYRSVVDDWGQGRLLGLVAPSLEVPQAREAAGAFERAAASPAMAAALVESLGLLDVRDLMGRLALPTMVLHRDGDMVPLADARMVARHIRGAHLSVLTGRDHLPWAGDWQPVVEEILAFLGQVAPARAQSRRAGRGHGDRHARRARPALGWPSLTEAERPVVRMAAEGRTNAQIAAGLFLSRTRSRPTSSTRSPSLASSPVLNWPRWRRRRVRAAGPGYLISGMPGRARPEMPAEDNSQGGAVTGLLTLPPPPEAREAMAAIPGMRTAQVMFGTQQGPGGHRGPEQAGAIVLLQATFTDPEGFTAFWKAQVPLMELLQAAPGFIRQHGFADGPHLTLIAFWRTADDARAFAARPEHRAAVRDLYQQRWQYSHFAAIWEMTANHGRQFFCQCCPAVTPAPERRCGGCGAELLDAYRA